MSISIGPFTLTIAESVKLSGVQHDRWDISYAGERFAWHHLPTGATQATIAQAFAEDIATWCAELQQTAPPKKREAVQVLRLIDVTTDVVLGTMPWAAEVDGLRNAIPDDRAATWLTTSTVPAMAMPMTVDEFKRLRPAMVALHTERMERDEQDANATAATLPSRHWICSLLPGAVLSQTTGEWRPPTSWEIRHIVGEGSLTGISGAKAAELIGVTPQNFRKYTASDDAKTRQNMGFAMWHHLLHRLDIQRPSVWSGK